MSLGWCGAPALADGLRGVAPGASCATAAVIEPALGSTLTGVGESGAFWRYSGRYSGRDADIVYFCDGQQLVEQIITIDADDRAHAFRLAAEIRQAAIEKFGSPAHDGLGLNAAQKLWYSFWGVAGDVMLQSTIWNVDHSEVFLWVARGANDHWGVRYSQSAPATLIVNDYAGLR